MQSKTKELLTKKRLRKAQCREISKKAKSRKSINPKNRYMDRKSKQNVNAIEERKSRFQRNTANNICKLIKRKHKMNE